MLAAPVSGERFQPVCRRGAQISQVLGMMQHVELAQRLPFNSAKALDEFALPQALGAAVPERPDQLTAPYNETCITSNV